MLGASGVVPEPWFSGSAFGLSYAFFECREVKDAPQSQLHVLGGRKHLRTGHAIHVPDIMAWEPLVDTEAGFYQVVGFRSMGQS